MNDCIRDLIADIRFCNKQLAGYCIDPARERAYRDECMFTLQRWLKNRHTKDPLDRYGYPNAA